MSRSGPAYPVTPEWQQWVRDRIAELGLRDAEVARRAGIAKSTLSEVLSPGAVWSTVMPEIHRALEWPPPLMAPPIYVLHVVEAFMRLPERVQGEFLERMRQAVAKRK